MSKKEFRFDQLTSADLHVDAVYKAGIKGNMSDDPLSKLMGCENQGGFRKNGKVRTCEYKLAILYSLMDDPDWPDSIDIEQGLFVYYRDNKEPGHELHETRKGGNKLLKFCFDAMMATPNQRNKVPPFFIFTRGTKGDSIDVEFALEAKCYKPGTGTGVRYTSRLISRLKNRQFGIFITTSYLGLQPYQEIREEEHPVIVISDVDIAKILINAGIRTTEEANTWLLVNFPKTKT